MLKSYTALIRQSEGWWIGWILEVRGAICQERTRSELLDTLQITLREILEFDTLGFIKKIIANRAIFCYTIDSKKMPRLIGGGIKTWVE